jgi:hypothetical protein
MATLGFEPVGSDSATFARYIHDEMAKYEKIIREAGIKPQ